MGPRYLLHLLGCISTAGLQTFDCLPMAAVSLSLSSVCPVLSLQESCFMYGFATEGYIGQSLP